MAKLRHGNLRCKVARGAAAKYDKKSKDIKRYDSLFRRESLHASGGATLQEVRTKKRSNEAGFQADSKALVELRKAASWQPCRSTCFACTLSSQGYYAT